MYFTLRSNVTQRKFLNTEDAWNKIKIKISNNHWNYQFDNPTKLNVGVWCFKYYAYRNWYIVDVSTTHDKWISSKENLR